MTIDLDELERLEKAARDNGDSYVRIAVNALPALIEAARGNERLRTELATVRASRDELSERSGKRILGCQCTNEFGDSACPIHPTCIDCETCPPHHMPGCRFKAKDPTP